MVWTRILLVDAHPASPLSERKAGIPMALHTSSFSSVVTATSTTEEILAVLAAAEPHGAPADHIARSIGLGLDGETVQGELEDLVLRGVLDRWGIGRGTLYTRGSGE